MDTYTYGGAGGRISAKTTAVYVGPNILASFTQGTTWNDLGTIASVSYPTDPTYGTCPSCLPRSVPYTYANGRLTRVGGYADSTDMTYHANGLVNQVLYNNGIAWQQSNDPNMMARPSRITASTFDTGVYHYDGAGNIKDIGGSNGDYFYYDAANRLLEDGTAGVARQVYLYDAFGNRTQPTMSSISPLTGPMSGGTSVSITGTSFRPGATITFGTAGPVAAQYVSDTQLTCVTPLYASEGPVPVTLNEGGLSSTFTPGFWFTPTPPSCPRGDANGDNQITIADVFYLINYLTAGGAAPVCSGDANNDTVVQISDVFYLINFLSAGSSPVYVTTGTNRLTALLYQNDYGAVTSDGTHTYTWDETETLRSSTGVRNWSFIYDANDERIGRWDRSTLQWKWTLRGLQNEILREATSSGGTFGTSSWSWGTDYIYRGTSLLASERTGGRSYYFLDHLGTSRLVTGAASNAHKFAPFGTELTSIYGDVETLKFTGHERDATTTSGYLDNMHARYYAASMGRFLSVDPKSIRNVHHPQTFNRYTYGDNNPLLKRDPDGREAQVVVGAVVGGFVGLAFGGYNEIRTALNQPVTWSGSTQRVFASIAGGAVSGAVGATCGTCALTLRFSAGVVGTVAGGAVNRAISGQKQTVDALQRDAIGGAAGFATAAVAAKLGTTVTQGVVDQYSMQAAAARADAAAQNLGLGYDKAANQAIQTVQTGIEATGVASGESVSNITGASLATQKPQAAPCTPGQAGCQR